MTEPNPEPKTARVSEDWLAAGVGAALLLVCLAAVLLSGGENPLAPYLATPGKWSQSPGEGLEGKLLGMLGAGVAVLVGYGAAIVVGGSSLRRFLPGFFAVFALATLAMVLSKQQVVAYWGLNYVLWAIVLGLLVSNTVGAPDWMRPALRPELFTKVGLVLLGAELLIGKLLAFSPSGVLIAWVVTPIVLVSTYWFGQKVLRIESPSLNMVVSADMSVCGVSAAIATAAATRAKKEELSLAISLSAAFTVAMMVLLPIVVKATGLPPAIGGAWIGGTIDSTGAVGAAGALLSSEADDTALIAATTIKMIQNVLIGVIAFGVAVYWVSVVEPKQQQETQPQATDEPRPRPELMEIWRRFPKFILGFFGASLLASALFEYHPQGPEVVESLVRGSTKTLRTWCFAIAFTAIGLETHFRTLAGTLRGGKPLVLYVCGQSLNLLLTLLMSWLTLGVLFPGAADAIAK